MKGAGSRSRAIRLPLHLMVMARIGARRYYPPDTEV
jgi:hypothetical protein